MSDYARLQEENAVLKAELEKHGTKTTADHVLKAENDRLRTALQDISDGGETKADMQALATKALAGK